MVGADTNVFGTHIAGAGLIAIAQAVILGRLPAASLGFDWWQLGVVFRIRIYVMPSVKE